MIAALALAVATAPFTCGAVERPGIAVRGDDGVWRGVAVDLCRKVAQTRHGADPAIAFHAYATAAGLRAARNDALAVLSSAELAIAWPGAAAPSKPPIAISRQVLTVRAGGLLHDRTQLAGHRVCFIIATTAEAALNAWAHLAGIAIQRVGFQEPVELRDAFDTGYCTAMAVDANDIPGGAAQTGVLGLPLAELPVFAVNFSRLG